MTKPLVTQLVGAPVDAGPVEVVERKGLGHHDTISNMLAEQFRLALCKFYRYRFGSPLHYNVDKALPWGGITKPLFGGGSVGFDRWPLSGPS